MVLSMSEWSVTLSIGRLQQKYFYELDCKCMYLEVVLNKIVLLAGPLILLILPQCMDNVHNEYYSSI